LEESLTQPTSLLPQIAGAYLPAASPAADLNDGERVVIGGLANKMSFLSPFMWTAQAYYDGTQRLADLGVSIPPQLAGVRTVVDWPRICVDPLAQRTVVDGFRLPNETDTDSELWEFWQSNNMDAEFPLCVFDALTLGRGYMIVGAPDVDGDPPIVTVESPFNMAMNWDPRTRRVTAAYQSFEAEGVYRAVLYLPDVTISMSRDENNPWTVDDRDEHNFGQVPVVRFANRQRTADREGRSEITPAIRNTTDSACRSLLGMEIAREFYSVPHRYVLGATESDFQDAQGNKKTALDMVISKMLAFERDENGNAPTVGQFQAFDPSVFTKIIDSHAQLMASFTQFPPEYFGQTHTANPASADAIRSAQDGMNRRARQVQGQFSDPLEQVMCLAWRFANRGAALPKEMAQLETDWQPVETPTPAATADSLLKQVQMGAVPATSDVVLARLNYSAVERSRLQKDRATDAAQSELAELAVSLAAKEARTDKAVIEDLSTPESGSPAAPGQ
jgi:hypothetical protein